MKIEQMRFKNTVKHLQTLIPMVYNGLGGENDAIQEETETRKA